MSPFLLWLSVKVLTACNLYCPDEEGSQPGLNVVSLTCICLKHVVSATVSEDKKIEGNAVLYCDILGFVPRHQ